MKETVGLVVDIFEVEIYQVKDLCARVTRQCWGSSGSQGIAWKYGGRALYFSLLALSAHSVTVPVASPLACSTLQAGFRWPHNKEIPK